jgi:hypothetical protein
LSDIALFLPADVVGFVSALYYRQQGAMINRSLVEQGRGSAYDSAILPPHAAHAEHCMPFFLKEIASMTPNHRTWFAWENRQPVGPTRLHVGGEVETPSAHRIPKLTRANPQGINPKILILNLTIEDSGKGGVELVDYRPAYYEEPTEQ